MAVQSTFGLGNVYGSGILRIRYRCISKIENISNRSVAGSDRLSSKLGTHSSQDKRGGGGGGGGVWGPGLRASVLHENKMGTLVAHALYLLLQ